MGCTGKETYVTRLTKYLTFVTKGITTSWYMIKIGQMGGALGDKRGTKAQEQWHLYFPNLVSKGKLRKAIHFICERETGGGGLLHENGRIKNRPLWIKLSQNYWQEKPAQEKPLRCFVEIV